MSQLFSNEQVKMILSVVREERALERARIEAANKLHHDRELERTATFAKTVQDLVPQLVEIFEARMKGDIQ